MNKKIIAQLILFFFIILFIGLFYLKYLFKSKTEVLDIKKINPSLNVNTNFSNTIENIEYISSDSLGNQYIIKAKYGEILDTDNNIILMKNVKAVIIFNNFEKINITSTTAVYNIKNYDTNFEKNVFMNYAEHSLMCNNIDLLIKDNKIKMYNDINYNNLNTDFLADGIEIDLLTKNLKAYMNNQDKKVKATYNNNVSN